MKCLHCGGEHPADYKFCPVTGKERDIHDGLKACLRPDCPDYGKYILPKEAKFCPRCGGRLSDDGEAAEPVQCINQIVSNKKEALADTSLLGKISLLDKLDKDEYCGLIVNWLCDECYKENGIDWRTDPAMMNRLVETVTESIEKYNNSSWDKNINISVRCVLNRDNGGKPVHTRSFDRVLSRAILYSLKHPEMIEDEAWGWSYVRYLDEGMILKRCGNKYGVVDCDGIVILPCEYQEIRQLKSGVLRFQKGYKYGLISVTKGVYIPCKYDQIRDFVGGLAEAMIGSIWYRVDKSGTVVEVKEVEGYRYYLENGTISVFGGEVVIGETDISAIGERMERENTGDEVYVYVNHGLVFMQFLNQSYVSWMGVIDNQDEYMKVMNTISYLKLSPIENQYVKDSIIGVTGKFYQTNDSLWKFFESEKFVSIELHNR